MSGTRTPLMIAVAAGVLLLVAIAAPVAGAFLAQGAETDRALAQLALYRAKIGAAPRLQATAEALARQEAEAGRLIAGGSTSLAAANMQNTILDIVQRHGGQVRSSQTLATPATASKGLVRVMVQFEVSLPPQGLLASTYELESRSPYLYVDAAEVRPEIYDDASSAPRALHVSWTVHAYRRTDAP